ncbi:MAG: hypothetical protein J6V36_02515 [Clostridia bacterium]|nr:hypothetical protein [Clostridia bacterium]
MNDNKIRFSIKVAEKEFSVEAFYSSTAELCKNFICEQKDKQIPVSISKEDIFNEKTALKRSFTLSKKDFEFFALHRKLSNALVSYKTVLFHGSAIMLNNKGIIFTAPSGTGKSTHSEKWKRLFDAEYINDDKPYISVKDKILVHGSPWMGVHRLGNNVSFPLSAICIICRSENNRIERVQKTDVFSELIKQTYMPKDCKNAKETLFLVWQLSLGVEVYKLHCNMDDEAAKVAYNGLAHLFL